MSDKNTLTIDALDSEVNVLTERKMRSFIDNKKLQFILNTLLTKSKSVFFAILGLLIFGSFWSLLSLYTKEALPTPTATLTVLYEMLRDPFYDYGPNDKGIGGESRIL